MARFGRRPFDVSRHNDDDDPLAQALAPPPNETPRERERRLAEEAEAQKRSDAIDEELNRQRQAEKKEPCIRILLLGQSESGKSTALKNFQLMNSPKAFREERASWRAVVQLNVVRSIRMILGVMSEVAGSSTSLDGHSRQDNHAIDREHQSLNPELLKLKMRLAPLQQVEEALLRKLSGSGEYEATHLSPSNNLPYAERSGKLRQELAVHSGNQWKGAFAKLMSSVRSSLDSIEVDYTAESNDPGVVLHACCEDMITLWSDRTLQGILRSHNVRLEDKSGFFLDSLERVTSLKYAPTDEDILRARLKTLGVSEHRFRFKNTGNMVSNDWRIFDVGGARSLRAAWVPFFDNMNAIIFLAPISAFDEVLSEDPSINRLEDSVLLWKSMISNPLLKKAQTVLFLNKIDLLRAKLEAGVGFGHYVVSYGTKPNDYGSVSTYLRKKFAHIHKQYSPEQRVLYCHLTTMTNPRMAQDVLVNVKDMVLRQNLQDSKLM